jgi:hypothetical protein
VGCLSRFTTTLGIHVQTERETKKEREREIKRERYRERKRERWRKREREIKRERYRERKRERWREREREKERERWRERERERERKRGKERIQRMCNMRAYLSNKTINLFPLLGFVNVRCLFLRAIKILCMSTICIERRVNKKG